MTSADRPTDTPPTNLPAPPCTPELVRAVENVLVAAHTLRASLAPDHLPFTASLRDAVERYGAGSAVVGLWAACKSMEALRGVWVARTDTSTPDA